MQAKPWEILKKEKLLETRIFDIEKRRCRSRVQEQEADFFVLDSETWVNIAAVTEDENIILIRQYRAGTDDVALEIPGGICEKGEDPADAGLRELKEETGFTAQSSRVLGYVRPNPAFMNNRCYTVLATGCRKTADTDFDEDEEIETIEVPLKDFPEIIRKGEIDHSLVWSAYVHMLHAGVLKLPDGAD